MSKIGTRIQTLLNYPLKWDQSEIDRTVPSSMGWLPVFSVVMAVGIFILSIACMLARKDSNWSVPLYWISLTLIFMPPAARFISRDISRTEGVGLIVILSIGTFLASYLRSPVLFRGFDEFLHWRTAYDIIQTRDLFVPNSLLPISPFYPGLENVTAALVSLTGLTIMEAAMIVLITARMIMLFGLFLLFEQLTGSVRTAGTGALVYMGSSTFLYFDAQYGYESLALPLAVMVILMLHRRGVHERQWRPGWNVLIAITMFAVVATHHVTTYMLIAFILLWTCTDIFTHFREGITNNPLYMGLWTFVLASIWIGTVARSTIDYLSPMINDSLNSFYGVITGTTQARRLFVDSAGRSAISLDQVLGIASVLVLLAGLAFGFWYWWLYHKKHAFAMALMLVAVIYPALPVMRLSGGSWEMSNRLSGFVFFGLSFIVALGLVKFPLPTKWLRLRQWIVVTGITIAFLGGVVAGASPDARLPQPYRAAAGERSIDNEGAMSAEWVRTVLGSNNRMAADRTLTNMMGSYGGQRMIVNLYDHVSISGIFVNYNLTPSHRKLITEMNIQYLVVDTRISKELSTLGYYFESWEQTMFSFEPPVNLFALEKFDYVPEISRIYDSGDIVVYDVGGVKYAP